jgi:CHAD domain-containing protein
MGLTDAEQLVDGLTAWLGDIEANLEPAIAGDGDEALHDVRVGIRRTRAALKHTKGVFRGKTRAAVADDFAWLQDATGPARDYEVWMSSLDQSDPLRLVLAGYYDDARRTAVDALDSSRTREALARWGRELTRTPESFDADARIARQHQRVTNAASSAGVGAPAEDLHRLRKRAKELRYLLELFPTNERRAMRKTLKELQDSLGAVQDATVQREWLNAHRYEVGPIDVRLKELDERDAVARTAAAEEIARFLSLPCPC